MWALTYLTNGCTNTGMAFVAGGYIHYQLIPIRIYYLMNDLHAYPHVLTLCCAVSYQGSSFTSPPAAPSLSGIRLGAFPGCSLRHVIAGYQHTYIKLALPNT